MSLVHAYRSGIVNKAGGTISVTRTRGTTTPSYLHLKLNETAGATTFTDSSANAFSITTGGNAVSIAGGKFGTGLQSGTTGYLRKNYSASDALASGNWTMQFWIKLNTMPSVIYSPLNYNVIDNGGGYGQCRITIQGDGSLRMLVSTSNGAWVNTNTTATGLITTNTWYHVAAVRNGSAFTLYVNGTSRLTYSTASALYNYAGPTVIGADRENNTYLYFLDGVMDDVQVVKTAIYTANFTAPTTESPTNVPVSGPVTNAIYGITQNY